MHASSLLFLLGASSATAATLPRQSACTDPTVRKEWRELTAPEQAEYLRAAVCLRSLPKAKYASVAAVTTRMDDLVYTHSMLQNSIHFVANFLP